MFTPFRVITLVAIAVFILGSSATLVAQPKVTTTVRAEDVFLNMPRPEYPLEARKNFVTGSGRYEVIFAPKTGIVTRVTVLETTGSKILDQAAVKALSQWRVRPGTIGRMRVPFTFTFAR